MTALSISQPFPIFTDSDGTALENGFIWIGVAGSEPISTPLTAYWDAALTQVVTQPVRTRGGYPLNGSDIGRLYVNSNYSIKVRNRNGFDLYSSLTATERYSEVVVNTNASQVVYNPAGTGAVATTVQAKLRESVSVKDFGAVGDGVTDDTAAFTSARNASSNGKYLIPPGTYVVNASPDVWSDTFIAPHSGTALIISGLTYDISGAFGSGWRNQSNTQRYLTWQHARTGAVIAIWSDGELSGDSNRFFLPFDVRRDSHFFIAAPATNGGSCDLLFRRSAVNADPQGNRFAINFEESLDRWSLTYATSASGSPAFDQAVRVIAGPSSVLEFPALPAMFNQGWKTQTRAGGALKLAFATATATTATLTDETSGQKLQTITRSGITTAGITSNTLLDTPDYNDGPQVFGGVFGDLISGANLPVTKNLYSTTGATRNQVIGTMRVAAQPSGAAGSYRETRILFDGTTVTLTDLINTLPVQIVATVALVSTNLQFQASYAGGLGGGCTITVAIEWCGTGR